MTEANETQEEIQEKLKTAAEDLNKLPEIDEQSTLRSGTHTLEFTGTPANRKAASLGIKVKPA